MEKEEKLLIARMVTSAVLTAALLLLLPDGRLYSLLYIIPYLIIGADVLLSAVKSIFKGELFDEKFLMSIASIGALVIGEYPEGIAVMLFYQLGEMLQDMAVEKSRRSITGLMELRPEFARVERNGSQIMVSPEEVEIGDIITVEAGERIPVDGTVIGGSAALDTKAVTGEGMPVDVTAGSAVSSGCIDLNGTLTLKVTRRYVDSAVAKMLELVESSAERKAKSESFITSFSRIYTPVVVIIALCVAVIPFALGQSLSVWLNRALVFLVVSCPCALVISVPLAYFAGIGASSKNGILIKGGDVLERLSQVSCVAFDKTGTVTRGNFAVTAVHPHEHSEEELLALAAAAEAHSNHPVSAALKEKCSEEKLSAEQVEELAGMGIKAVVNGMSVAVGNGRLMDSLGIKWHDCHKTGSIIHIAVDGEYAGHIVISDELKPEAAEAVRLLKKAGVEKTVILTGDNRQIAEETAEAIGADGCYAALLPADKVEKFLEIKASETASTVFVGDGINDAPVLKTADVGIAMGALGSDAAVESADAVIMDDDLTSLAELLKTAKLTRRKVRQNIVFSLAAKAIIMLLGLFGVPYMMWIAVFGDVGVSLIAVANSTMLLKKRHID